MDRYDHRAVERKWQDEWDRRGVNLFTEDDLRNARDPYYNLMMFPYPSAEGLHIGNIFAYTGADVNGRYWRLRGKDVFEPIGFDAFGIHSENYALKVGANPNDLVPQECRQLHAGAAAIRRHVRLEPRGQHYPGRLLQVERSGCF